MHGEMTITGRIIAVLVGVLLTLVALEIGVRTYDAYRGFSFFSSRRAEFVKPPLPFRTFGFDLYRDGRISSRHGELYPIEKQLGTFRIVVFGGSTTENSSAFQKARIHYPAVLQESLRKSLRREVEVINVANSAYAIPHSIILLSLDVISWNPDLVILSHNTNDLTASYWPGFTFDYSNKYSHDYYSVPDFSAYTVTNMIFRHSQLYWVVKARLVRAPGTLARRPYGSDPPGAALDVFKRNLRTFIGIARQNQIAVLLGTQPLMTDEAYFTASMAGKPYNDVVTYPLHAEFVAHHNIFNDAILSVADQEGTYRLDNRGALIESSADFIDFVHYTPEGVRKLAAHYAKFIIDTDIVE